MSPHNNNSGIQNLLFLPIILLLLCWASWYLYGTRILEITFLVSREPFEWFSKLPAVMFPDGVSQEYRDVSYELRGANPVAFGWETFKQMMLLWGYVLRYPIGIALLAVAVFNWKLPANYYYRRDLNLKQLAEQNSELFPCTKPALGMSLHKTDPYNGSWRVADDYIDFASGNALLTYKGKTLKPISPKNRSLKPEKKRKLFPHYTYVRLNKEKADRVYINQLGKPWLGVDVLPEYRKSLLTSLMCLVAGGDYREKGRTLLDQFSRSFVEKDGKEANFIDSAGVEELLAEVQFNEDVKEVIASHGYESTVFIGMLVKARLRSGKVPPSSFIWLRPTDRTLWYSLHAIGGRKPWSEGAAAWCHYYAEMDLRRSIATPVVEGATDGLERELFAEQWAHSESLAERYQAEQDEEEKLLREASTAGGSPRSGVGRGVPG